MSLISIKNLDKSYGTRRVLTGLDLRVEPGEFVSVVGQSGCGKSTLLFAIAGFLPYEGIIERPQHVGIVFQNYALYHFMTCEANIALGLGHLPKIERAKKVQEYLRIIGLADDGRKYPWQLSGGESQRIAIARAFATDPDAVLLDEPFSALDLMRREAMAEWLMSFLAERPTTVVFVTHWLDEAILLGDRVVAMADGRIVQDFKVGFPRPRNEALKADPTFVRLRNEIRDSLSTSAHESAV